MLRQQSIKCASLAATAVSQVYYDNWHKRFSADFPRRVLLFEEALLWSVTKPQIMTLFYLTRLVSVSSKQELQTSEISFKANSYLTLSIKPCLSLLMFSQWMPITHKPDKRSSDIVCRSHSYPLCQVLNQGCQTHLVLCRCGSYLCT